MLVFPYGNDHHEMLMAVMPVFVPMKMVVPEMVGVTKRFAEPTFNEVISCPLFVSRAYITP